MWCTGKAPRFVLSSSHIWLGFVLLLLDAVPSAADASLQGRELRGGGGGGGGGGSSGGGDSGEDCDGFCEGGEMMLVLAAVGSVAMCAALGGFIWWKRKSDKEKLANCNHTLTQTTASALLAAGHESYQRSWCCDVCNSPSSDLQVTFYRCNTCKIDWCQQCYASKPRQATTFGLGTLAENARQKAVA